MPTVTGWVLLFGAILLGLIALHHYGYDATGMISNGVRAAVRVLNQPLF